MPKIDPEDAREMQRLSSWLVNPVMGDGEAANEYQLLEALQRVSIISRKLRDEFVSDLLNEFDQKKDA